MKPRLLRPLFIGVALLTFGSLAAACGGDGGSTAEEYFLELDAIDEDVEARIDAVEAEIPTAFQELEAARGVFDKIYAIYVDGIDRLDDLDPPDDVEAAHDEFRDAVVAQQGLLGDIADESADLESVSGIAQVLERNDAGLEASGSRIEAACVELQAIATGNGVDVDLECED